MNKLFTRKKTEHPASGFGIGMCDEGTILCKIEVTAGPGRTEACNNRDPLYAGEWEWWEKDDSHKFLRALSLGSSHPGEYNGG